MRGVGNTVPVMLVHLDVVRLSFRVESGLCDNRPVCESQKESIVEAVRVVEFRANDARAVNL